jgi:FAD/FMN-containing dehydrogenase
MEPSVAPVHEIAGFEGEQLRPGDRLYDATRRVFNAMIDRCPALIARPNGTADVAAAVRHAREHGLPIAVHGGGHSVTGHGVCNGGVMIDLRRMKAIAVDPQAGVVDVQGGVRWGELDAELESHGRALTGGRVPSTGVAGLALGSGSGWLERKFGFTCDSLVSAEVVLADGRVVTASDDSHPELFWGLRGGGGNFGIVTTFRFRTHPIPPLMFAGMVMYPHDRSIEVMMAWRDFMAGARDEIGGAMAYISAPPLDFVPEPARGRPVLGLVVAYCGDPQEGRRELAPLLDLDPVVAMVDDMPYTAVQRLLEAPNPPGMRNYWTADFLGDLPEDALVTLHEHSSRVPSPMTQIIVVPGGGAVARVDDDATAFAERRAPFNIHYLSMWPDPADDERNITWTRELATAMKGYTTGRAYLNFLGDEGAERVRNSFGAERWARLQAVKRVYDPDNAFRLNQNIPPG